MNELKADSDETLGLLFDVAVLAVVPVVDTPTTGSAADTTWNSNRRTKEQNKVEEPIFILFL